MELHIVCTCAPVLTLFSVMCYDVDVIDALVESCLITFAIALGLLG